MAHDNPIPGFNTRNCINLRLWAAKPSREFDLEAFNTGGQGLCSCPFVLLLNSSVVCSLTGAMDVPLYYSIPVLYARCSVVC